MNIKILILSLALFVLGCSSLIENPKIPNQKYSAEESEAMLEKVNSLEGEGKKCFKQFVHSYQKALFNYCEATNGGHNVGGGCHHVAYAWSLTQSVMEAGLNACEPHT